MVNRTIRRISRVLVATFSWICVASLDGVQAQQCAGDCNASASVTVDELVRSVNIALGSAELSTCAVTDLNGDGNITVDELVKAVNNALNGCPAESTATATEVSTVTPVLTATPTEQASTPTTTSAVTDVPTATLTESPAATTTLTTTATPTASMVEEQTATPTNTGEPEATVTPTGSSTATPVDTTTETPTATASATDTLEATETPLELTPTPSPTVTQGTTMAGDSIAGRAALISNSVGALNNVISGVIVAATNGIGFPLTIGGPMGSGGDIDNCTISGTTSQDCTEVDGSLQLTLGATNCKENGPFGGTATFNGSIDLAGPGTCSLPVPIPAAFVIDLNVVLASTSTLLTVTADLSGELTPVLDIFDPCFIGSLSGTISGTLRAAIPDGTGSIITFDNTSFEFSNPTYNAQCVPVVYDFTFNGPATITALGSNESFAVEFTQFIMTQNAQANPVTVSYNGSLSSPCFGGELAIQSLVPVAVTAGELCPNAGMLSVSGGGTAEVTYLSDGSIEIDRDGDGNADVTYPSCTDPALLMCVIP